MRHRRGLVGLWAGLLVLGWWASIAAVAGGAGIVAVGAAITQPTRARRGITMGVAGVCTAAGIGALVAAGVARAVRQEESDRAAHEVAASRLLPHDPAGVLIELARLTARPDGDAGGCALFTDTGQATFAAAQHASDCVAALHNLRARMTAPDRYGEIDRATVHPVTEADGTIAEVDGCAISWRSDNALDVLLNGIPEQRPRPGPSPGHLTVVRVFGGAWQISAYRTC